MLFSRLQLTSYDQKIIFEATSEYDPVKTPHREFRDETKMLQRLEAGKWHCESFKFLVNIRFFSDTLRARDSDNVVLQDRINGTNLQRWLNYLSELRQRTQDGNSYYRDGGNAEKVNGWWLNNERMYRLRIQSRFLNVSIINDRSQHLGYTSDDREGLYARLEHEYYRCLKNDMKIVSCYLNVIYSCWVCLKTILNSTKEIVMGIEQQRRRNEWFDDEYQSILNEKDITHSTMLQHATSESGISNIYRRS